MERKHNTLDGGVLLVLPTKARIIVFRFIIEYSSLRDFWAQGNRSILIIGFLKDDVLACVEA